MPSPIDNLNPSAQAGYQMAMQLANGLTIGAPGAAGLMGAAASGLASAVGGVAGVGLNAEQEAYLAQVQAMQRQNNQFQLALMQRANQSAQEKQLVDQFTEESKAAMQTSNTMIATQVEQGNAIKGRTEKVQL